VDEIDRAQMYDQAMRDTAVRVAVDRARAAQAPQVRTPAGVAVCRNCGEVIPSARLHALPAACLCLACATGRERTASRRP
jgi:phage/conjugal plasmid C-4 type zinc finger TraR family protein